MVNLARDKNKKLFLEFCQKQNIYTGGESKESPGHVYNELYTIVHILLSLGHSPNAISFMPKGPIKSLQKHYQYRGCKCRRI